MRSRHEPNAGCLPGRAAFYFAVSPSCCCKNEDEIEYFTLLFRWQLAQAVLNLLYQSHFIFSPSGKLDSIIPRLRD